MTILCDVAYTVVVIIIIIIIIITCMYINKVCVYNIYYTTYTQNYFTITFFNIQISVIYHWSIIFLLQTVRKKRTMNNQLYATLSRLYSD